MTSEGFDNTDNKGGDQALTSSTRNDIAITGRGDMWPGSKTIATFSVDFNNLWQVDSANPVYPTITRT